MGRLARSTKACFLLLGLVLTSPALAGNGRWTPFGPAQGQPVALAVHRSGALFAAARFSGVYKSTNGGRSWSWSGRGTGGEWIGALAADTDDGDLYAVGETFLFRSADGGATWTAAGPLPAGSIWFNVLALVPGEPDVLFLAREGRLFRSDDEGETWTALFAGPAPIAALLVLPGSPRSVLVGTWQDVPGAGLYRSLNDGATWAKVTNVRNEPPAFPGDTRHPFDRGVIALAAVAGSQDTLFAIAGQFLFRSRDGGASWGKILLPDPGTGFANAVTAGPGPHPLVYVVGRLAGGSAAREFGLFASRDLGNTWKRIDRGGAVAGRFLQVDRASGLFHVLSYDGVGRGTEEGTRWSRRAFGNLGCQAGPGEGDCGGRLRFAPGEPSWLWAVAGSIWTSGDRGRTWTSVRRGSGFSDLALDPLRSGTLYASAEGGLFGSTDAGKTWTRLLRGVASGYYSPFYTVAVPASGQVLAGGCGIWRSTDGGAKWKKTLGCPVLPLPPFGDPQLVRWVERFRFDPQRPQVVYAEITDLRDGPPLAAFTDLYRSTDGGSTWRLFLNDARALAIDPTDAQTLYALRPGGLLRSRDGGATWTQISDFGLGRASRGEPSPGDLAVDPFDARVLWAGRSDGIWRSEDGGATWEPLSAGLRSLQVHDLFLDGGRPGHLYVGSVGLWEASFPTP